MHRDCEGAVRPGSHRLRCRRIQRSHECPGGCQEDQPLGLEATATCSASPSSVHATTTSTSATPGAIATHGALTSASRPDAIIPPHDGAGGCTPSPRNESPASSVIALPTPSAAAAITGVSAFGRTCRPSTRPLLAPSDTAAPRTAAPPAAAPRRRPAGRPASTPSPPAPPPPAPRPAPTASPAAAAAPRAAAPARNRSPPATPRDTTPRLAPANAAHQHADQHRQRHAQQSHAQRYPRAVHQPGPHVSAQAVGAEQVEDPVQIRRPGGRNRVATMSAAGQGPHR